MYRATYSDRQHHPHHITVGAIYRRCMNVQGGRRLCVEPTSHMEEHVLHDIENNPCTSHRQVARQHGVSQRRLSVSYMTTAIIPVTSSVCRGYHRQIFLHGKDSVAGLCNRPSPLWDFLSSDLFTDEATFGCDGIINLHNRHLWAKSPRNGRAAASLSLVLPMARSPAMAAACFAGRPDRFLRSQLFQVDGRL